MHQNSLTKESSNCASACVTLRYAGTVKLRTLIALLPLVVLPACSASGDGDAAARSDAPAPAVSSMSAAASASPAAAAISREEAAQLIEQLRAFAQEPNAAQAEQLPFARTVRLGLGDALVKEVAAAELSDAGSWSVPTTQDLRWTGLSSLNVLERLAEDEPYVTTLGSHPHCASPARPAPAAVADHVRVSTQPSEPASCTAWYTVDLFLQDDKIHAVTLDLYEP